ncbi:MAG: PSD1 and planctomycete cytochrome C domain-containing protein [Planctomycetaceae bacterium]|nr:PSD1 and planctomycete cytochrome C domain-containing protein [Planctomycetaceae bacterium]
MNSYLSLPRLVLCFLPVYCLPHASGDEQQNLERPATAAPTDSSIQFNQDVRAILSEHCFECHGPDAENRSADLRLDVEDDAHAYAISPGDLNASPLWERVTSADADVVMPPPEAKKPLSEKQIDTLKRWIQQGAQYEKHWAFMPIERPDPGVAAEDAIDLFIDRMLKRHNLQPAGSADRRTLARRLALDLTGMPLSPEHQRRYLADESPDAYEKLVDELLASPHFGEHMALPWLEAARYADTSGYQADWERFMWPWRTWVIDAFNDNLPFDQFTVEQLAGDMLPNPSRSQLLATGFNRNHRINDEGGVIAAEYAVEYVVDRVDTTSTVWLGLTMGCCRCHDHKYDPLPQQDFYNMFALFNNVPEKGKDGRRGYSLPVLDVPDPAVEQQLQSLHEQQETLTANLQQAVTAAGEERVRWEADMQTRLAESGDTSWKTLRLTGVKGTGGVKFQRQDDESFLRAGANPAQSTYSADVSSEVLKPFQSQGITAFRLEALVDPSLSAGSLAASVNGNFVLSEFLVEVITDGRTRVLDCSTASADYSQANYPPQNVIDSRKETGWAVEGHVRKENRKLMVVLAETYRPQAGDSIRIQLQHSSPFARHCIGRFRLGATAAAAPTLDGKTGMPALVAAGLSAMSPTDEQRKAVDEYFVATSPLFAKLRKQQDALNGRMEEAAKKQFVKVMVMSEMEQPRPTFVLNRGQYDQPDENRPATADAPAVLGGLAERPHNRLGFAQWLVSPDNPLTARVTVNRFWQQFFGRGLVETVEDFGSQGTLPSHPELLDWLAADFRDNGWDVKRLIRQMVTSDAYRRSSVIRPQDLEKDPRNIWLARASRVRLSGYQLRDQALAASGLLVRTLGGPSVKPYQPPGLWSEVSFQQKNRSTDFYVQDHGEKLYRRGLYTFWKRSVAPPMLANFDAAGREMCTVKSTRTSTPLQALNLMNDVTFVEAARAMGQRMLQQGGDSLDSQLSFGIQLVGIEASATKLEILRKSHARYTGYFTQRPQDAAEFLSNGEWEHDPSLDDVSLAAMAAVASVILNLDEVIMRQ